MSSSLVRQCFDTARKLKSELETLQSEIAKDPKLKSEQDTQLKDFIELTETFERFLIDLDSELTRKPLDSQYLLIEEFLNTIINNLS